MISIYLLAFGLLIAGCSDSAFTEVKFDDEEKIDTRYQFEVKAKRFMEKIYGIPWSELSQMEAMELAEIEIDFPEGVETPRYGQILEEWGELQGLIKELALSDEDMMSLIKLDEAFAAGKHPEDIDFGFYGTQAGKTHGCEDGCYAEADRKISDLYRSH